MASAVMRRDGNRSPCCRLSAGLNPAAAVENSALLLLPLLLWCARSAGCERAARVETTAAAAASGG